MADLHVEVVSVERTVWDGDVDQVVARTTEGDIGVLAGHVPVLAQLSDGAVIRLVGGDAGEIQLAAHGGFLSVTNQGVTVLAETAELGEDVDVQRARNALDRSRDADEEGAGAARRRAQARLRAAGEQV